MADLNMPEVTQEEKMTKDYSEHTQTVIADARGFAKEGNLVAAIDVLLQLEKQTRSAADMHSTSKILVCIVELCFEARDWKAMQENIVMLTKRRGQLKAAVTKMVQKAMEYVEQTPDLETKLELIDTLRDVTAGKIYVEIERARLTMELAHIKEGQGKVGEAADILQELQVETFGSMEKKEKIDVILEQMRLCLAKNDFIRTHIISKKISPRSFDGNKLPEEKLRYYNLMVELEEHENAFLSICRHYMNIYSTPSVQEDAEQWKPVLKNIVVYVLLAPYDNEQWDLVNRIIQDKNLNQLPFYKELLQTFVTQVIMPWSKFTVVFGDELFACEALQKVRKDLDRKEEFRKRLVEHNLRVVAKCYTRISTQRLSVIMELPPEETENYVSRLVTGKMIFAKIDRPAGIVTFTRPKNPNEGLNEWLDSVNKLMSLVEKSTHLINLSRSWTAPTTAGQA